jgi:hypothetical protein
MKLLFLYGPPAVGKLTVAREVSALTGWPVFHNHMSVDLAREFFEFGSPGFAKVVDTLRMAMFEAAAIEPLDGLIFTFVYGLPHDDPWVQGVIDLVERHGGEVLFVRLRCPPEILLERVALPDRTRYRKMASPEMLATWLEQCDVLSALPFVTSLNLDTSQVQPSEAARRIVAHYAIPLAASKA